MKKAFEKIKLFFKNLWNSTFFKGILILIGMIIFLRLFYYIPFLGALNRKYIYPIWLICFGWISSIFPMSLEEFNIGLFLLCLSILFILLIILIFTKHKKYKLFCIKYSKCLIMWLTIDISIMMIVSTPLARSPRLLERDDEKIYTIEEMQKVRDYVLQQINELSTKVEVDDNDYAYYSKNYVVESKKAMQNIAEKYPLLKGYYPNAKSFISSRILTLCGILGVTYYDTLSVNYNNEMYSTAIPATICHEYAHIKGYIREDEANFIGFIACINYDDFFKYSGYLSILGYINDDYRKAAKELYVPGIITERGYKDWTFFKPNVIEEINNSPIDQEIISDISDKINDATIKANGDELGNISYSYVSKLVFKYYEGVLF